VFLFVLAIILLWVKRRAWVLLALAWILLPVLAILITPFGHAVRIRYFIFVLPVYLLLVAYGLAETSRWLASHLARVSRPASNWAAALLLVILAGCSLPSLTAYYAEGKQNWRDATHLVSQLARPADIVYVTHVYHREGLLFYAGQTGQDPSPLSEETVQLLPGDPVAAFPLAAEHGYWLVVPVRGRFLPGGSLDAELQPHYGLQPVETLSPSNVPLDAELIAPTSYRSLAVVAVTPSEPPSIHFWADESVVSRGACTSLRWDVENVREVYLQGAGVVGQGDREVCPTADGVYELRVVHRDGTETRRVVNVAVEPP
jgi:hypothetical protein